MSAITIEQYNKIAEETMPFARILGLQLESIDDEEVVMRAVYNSDFLRPGGTVSGPVMMGLAVAEVNLYSAAADLGEVVAHATVTYSIPSR